MAGRIVLIDWLRALSVLYIVGFWHLLDYTPVFPGYHNPITYRTTVLVLGLFVFLSGYLLASRPLAPGREGLVNFYKSRFLRIYPLYFGAIVLFFVLKLTSGTGLLKATFLVSMFWGPSPLTLWFITMIMFFYLIAPFLIRSADQGARFYLWTLGIFTVLALIIQLSPSGDMRILIYFPAFATGVLMARASQASTAKLAMATLGFAAAIALSFSAENVPEFSLLSLPLACLGPLWLLLIARQLESRFPSNRTMSFINYAGFVMYLIHRPVYSGFKALYFPEQASLQLLYLLALCLPCLALLSWCVQKTYDIISANYFDRKKNQS